jgi:mxaK protein
MRTRNRLVLAMALVSLALTLWQLQRIGRAVHWNRMIAAGQASDSAAQPAEVRFAAAYAMESKGRTQEALNVYRELMVGAAPRLKRDAMFNSANAYLTQALAMRHDSAESSAFLTVVELAKASYRELLREDSTDWDARYNLEKALRLAPDPEGDPETFFTPPSQLRTPPVGQGTDLGLP